MQTITSAAIDCGSCNTILRSLLSEDHHMNNQDSFENLYSQPQALSRAVAGKEVDSKTGRVSKLTLGLLVADCGENIANIILMNCLDVTVKETVRIISPAVFEGLVSKLAITLPILDLDMPHQENSDAEINNAFEKFLSRLDEILKQGDYLLQLVQSWNLPQIVTKPLLLNGDELAMMFPILLETDKRVFAEMRLIQQRWQIVFPSGTKEELMDFMKQVYSQR